MNSESHLKTLPRLDDLAANPSSGVQWLTVKEAAKKTTIAQKTIYKWVKEGRLPGYKVEGKVILNEQEIDQYIHSHRIVASVKTFDLKEETKKVLERI